MEMAQGFKEISISMTESLKNFSSSMIPIIKAKDDENRKLKRLLSERIAVEDDAEIEDLALLPKRRIVQN
jgi:hypothetical protein